jgi:hypothetical protein
MHRQGSRGSDYRKRREAIWDAMSGCSYLAAERLAKEEQLERAIIEAAYQRLLTPVPAGEGQPSVQSAGRRAKDALLVMVAQLRERCAAVMATASLRKGSAG